MEVLSQSPFALPGLSEYLQLLSHQLPASNFCLEEWINFRVALLSVATSRAIIVDVAQKLQAYPRLLHGANCLFGPRYRIHCSTTSSEVKHFVISNQDTHCCEILSLTSHGFTTSSTRPEIQQLLFEPEKWDQEIGLSGDDHWLACVAQVLQEILNDPQTEEGLQSITRTRLGRLGKAGILPPSVFIHFADSNIPQFESMREFSTSGGFCDAHKITVNNLPLCFRVLRQWEDSDSDKVVYKQFCRELSVWYQLKHPNILPLIGATTEAFPRRYCFIVPWMCNGSLTSYIKAHPEYNKYLAVTQIVEGLSYLHGLNPPVGHKDLKGDNVLVRADLVCVITDFGLASLLDSQRSTSLGRGSQYWRAPELGLEEAPHPDCRPRDIYSLGSTIAEILIGEPPKSIWFSVIRGLTPKIPPHRSPDWGEEEQSLWSIARACLVIAPEMRPAVSDIRRYFQTPGSRPTYLGYQRLLHQPNGTLDVPFNYHLRSSSDNRTYVNGHATYQHDPDRGGNLLQPNSLSQPALAGGSRVAKFGLPFSKWGLGIFIGDRSHLQMTLPPVDETSPTIVFAPREPPRSSNINAKSIQGELHDPKKDKKEAQRLKREAELEKRKLLERNRRAQARAVTHKRQKLLQEKVGHDPEWGDRFQAAEPDGNPPTVYRARARRGPPAASERRRESNEGHLAPTLNATISV